MRARRHRCASQLGEELGGLEPVKVVILEEDTATEAEESAVGVGVVGEVDVSIVDARLDGHI